MSIADEVSCSVCLELLTGLFAKATESVNEVILNNRIGIAKTNTLLLNAVLRNRLDPRLLQCSHSFCFKCIVSMAKPDGAWLVVDGRQELCESSENVGVSCPQCRKQTPSGKWVRVCLHVLTSCCSC
jgi:hypothetical protein